jgi:hypothetical protein
MHIMSSRDEWRITTAAIQLEMERISGLLQKSVHFQSRTSAPHALHQRHETKVTPELTLELIPYLVHKR